MGDEKLNKELENKYKILALRVSSLIKCESALDEPMRTEEEIGEIADYETRNPFEHQDKITYKILERQKQLVGQVEDEIEILVRKGAYADKKAIISDYFEYELDDLKAKMKTRVYCPACKWKYFDKYENKKDDDITTPDFGECSFHPGEEYDREREGCDDFINHAMDMKKYLKDLDKEITITEIILKGETKGNSPLENAVLKHIPRLK